MTQVQADLHWAKEHLAAIRGYTTAARGPLQAAFAMADGEGRMALFVMLAGILGEGGADADSAIVAEFLTPEVQP